MLEAWLSATAEKALGRLPRGVRPVGETQSHQSKREDLGLQKASSVEPVSTVAKCLPF